MINYTTKRSRVSIEIKCKLMMAHMLNCYVKNYPNTYLLSTVAWERNWKSKSQVNWLYDLPRQKTNIASKDEHTFQIILRTWDSLLLRIFTWNKLILFLYKFLFQIKFSFLKNIFLINTTKFLNNVIFHEISIILKLNKLHFCNF